MSENLQTVLNIKMGLKYYLSNVCFKRDIICKSIDKFTDENKIEISTGRLLVLC